MAKNILFLVTGMTPQIVTETLWALACDSDNDDKWIPNEIHVVSTEHGLNQVRGRLFEQGVFAAMQAEYSDLAAVDFSPANLHAILGSDGVALTDLKTPEDNEMAADFVCEKIRQFTSDENVALHVSIAGGRKTMGFYAGYALSLYGRAQDCMSHVLVDERYEPATNFYYPSRNASAFALDRDGKVIGPARDARIWLAKIPFVRMKDAINKQHQLLTGEKFSQVVEKINESFSDVSIELDVASASIKVNDKFSIDLPPREFAFYHLFADYHVKDKGRIQAPRKTLDDKSITTEEARHINQLTDDFRELYLQVKPNLELDDLDEQELDVDKDFFQQVKSLLNTNLKKELGLELAARVAIVQEGKGKPFYIDLPVEAITIKLK